MKILRDLRKEAGITLRQIEEVTGLSNAYLSQLENGKIKYPSAQALYVLAKFYSTCVEDLLIAAGFVKEEPQVMPIQMKKADGLNRVDQLEKEVNQLNIAIKGIKKVLTEHITGGDPNLGIDFS